MRVQKRNGRLEEVSFDKVIRRMKNLANQEPICPNVDCISVAQKVCARIYDNVSTTELDELAANICMSMATDQPEYGYLASRILISNCHKNTPPSFAEAMEILWNNRDKSGKHVPIISESVYELSKRPEVNACINHMFDFKFDFFGFKTLEKSYLKRVDGKLVETPQYMWMRVALGIHGDNLERAFETYRGFAEKRMIHATPTLFHSGTPSSQFLSCFLLGMEDSIQGIYKCLADCAQISKWAGGIGFNVSNIRSSGALIRGTNGTSDGVIPMLRVFNDTALYVNQSGKRSGSFAVYLEPWHPDVIDFLDLKKNHGDEAKRCRDLFYAMWIPDLFMKRVEDGGVWSLMDPDECPGLAATYGEEFERLYTQYEADGRFRKQLPAQEVFDKIIESQIETGTPYIGYKDAANRKTNQKNLGTIRNSNLCHEIIEYSDAEEYACCTLASIGLPAFVEDTTYNFTKLADTVRVLVRNLNIIIDKNYYPVPETRRSNLRHRPIGLGVQGLADVYMSLRMPFDSVEAAELNKQIFATIYYAAVEESVDLAIAHTTPANEYEEEIMKTRSLDANCNHQGAYTTFEGSPMSRGEFQFDMWGVEPVQSAGEMDFNWEDLRQKVVRFGLRNSLLVAPMPTASTSQILGNNECFEPITSNIYVRRVLAGDYVVINKYLINDLIQRGLWSRELKEQIILDNGSVQKIAEVPADLKALYKTSWDLSMKSIIDQAADRGAYICQTQSMNLFMARAEFKKIRSMHLYAWKRGLKTGMYYLRTLAVAQAAQVTVDPKMTKKKTDEPVQPFVCRRDDPDCLMCSS